MLSLDGFAILFLSYRMIVCHNKTAIWTVDREVSYSELLSRISDTAVERHDRRNNAVNFLR